MKPVDDLEAERLKAAADAELTLSTVKPIQTDFHFFVSEVKDKLRIEAEKEVAATAPADKKNDLYLINSNLNCRIMKAWENLTDKQREDYMKKEEADRRRFMEEDEVASRHCATLTARVKSPAEPGTGSPSRKSKKALKREEDEEDEEEEDDDDEDEKDTTKRPTDGEDENESPTKKIKDEE